MRMLNRVLAVLFAFALLVLGILIPTEVIRAALSKRHWLLPWESLTSDLTGNSWQAGPVRAVLIGAAVVGLLLLVGQLKPRRPSALPLSASAAGVQASTTRRSLQQTLQRAAAEVDGVSGATARVGRRTAKITARAFLRDAGGLQEQVTEHVTGRLDSLSLAHSPRLTVRVQQKVSR